jgi:hypothetical protein
MDWFFYDTNGKKHGAYSVAVIKALAESGVITPDTIIENANGRSAKAGTMKGLKFLPQTPPVKVPVPKTTPVEPFKEQPSEVIPFQVPVQTHITFCTNCGKGIPPLSRFCPGCGKDTSLHGTGYYPPSKPSPPTIRSKSSSLVVVRTCGISCLGMILIFIAIVIKGSLSIISNPPREIDYSPEAVTKRKESDLESKLRSEAQNYVRLHLKHPKEAKFGWLFTEVQKKDRGDTIEYIVIGDVTAKNAFGATFKHDYNVIFTYDKKTGTYIFKDCLIE